VDAANVSNFVRKLFRASLHRQRPDGTTGGLADGTSGDAGHDHDESSADGGDSAAEAAEANKCEVARGREVWFFEVQGQAFLWHQVKARVCAPFPSLPLLGIISFDAPPPPL
jgi:hypothetical protein